VRCPAFPICTEVALIRSFEPEAVSAALRPNLATAET
jgi:hypothetical protein